MRCCANGSRRRKRDSQETLATLNWSDVPARLISQWQAQLETIVAAVNQPSKSPTERDAQVAAAFRELSATNTLIAQEARHTIEERRLRLQQQLKTSRQRLTRLVAVEVVLALLLAVAVGVWLSRPFKRIERAILGLGENRLERPIQISGPADVRRLGRQLDWLRLRLVQLDADKTRFLRHVSHEIKTPLAALTEGVALLEDGTAGSLSDDQREIARILSHNTQALQSQIEALLRFNAAAFDANRLLRVPTDLRLLVEQQVEAQRLQWQARALDLRGRRPRLGRAGRPGQVRHGDRQSAVERDPLHTRRRMHLVSAEPARRAGLHRSRGSGPRNCRGGPLAHLRAVLSGAAAERGSTARQRRRVVDRSGVRGGAWRNHSTVAGRPRGHRQPLFDRVAACSMNLSQGGSRSPPG